MKKLKEVKIRREWTRHPATRVKEDNESKDICEQCGAYRHDPMLCQGCEGEHIGGA